MADFTPTTWVDNNVPAISAAQLNRIEAGVLDAAVSSKQRGPLTGQGARPAAAASNKNWLWIDSATGAMSYSDGSQWYAVGGGGGGSSAALYDQTITVAAGTVTINGLDPTNDGYNLEIDGVVAQGGAARNVAVLPNGTKGANSAGNYIRGTLMRTWVDAGGTINAPQTIFTTEVGFLLAAMTTTEDVDLLATMRIHAKANTLRTARSFAAAGSVGASVNHTSQHHGASKWADATTALASLVVDFGGGTFTGRVQVSAAV